MAGPPSALWEQGVAGSNPAVPIASQSQIWRTLPQPKGGGAKQGLSGALSVCGNCGAEYCFCSGHPPELWETATQTIRVQNRG
jgi:hypothetical protein